MGKKKVKEMEEKKQEMFSVGQKRHITAYYQRSSRVSYLMFILCMLMMIFMLMNNMED